MKKQTMKDKKNESKGMKKEIAKKKKDRKDESVGMKKFIKKEKKENKKCDSVDDFKKLKGYKM